MTPCGIFARLFLSDTVPTNLLQSLVHQNCVISYSFLVVVLYSIITFIYILRCTGDAFWKNYHSTYSKVMYIQYTYNLKIGACFSDTQWGCSSSPWLFKPQFDSCVLKICEKTMCSWMRRLGRVWLLISCMHFFHACKWRGNRWARYRYRFIRCNYYGAVC
jgi:hypothetical protein